MTVKEFLLALPEKVDKDIIDGMETLFHFDIGGDEGGQVSLQIKDNEILSFEGFNGEANCVVTADGDDLKKILKGETNPLMALLTGKLKVSNKTEMMKYAKVFGIM